MSVSKVVRKIGIEHPTLWIVFGVPLFMYLSRLPINSWNVEMTIARNLLDGFGFVGAPLDPPALWRPPLAVAVLLPIELLVGDPKLIYTIFGTLTLVGFIVSMFYLMKMLGGRVAAHFSLLLILSTPAFTSMVGHQLQLLSYLLSFSIVTLSIFATLWSWRRPDWKRGVVAGLCWGAALLTRPESILLFAVSAFSVLVFHRALGIAPKRAVWSLVFQLAAFLAIYEPSTIIFRTTQQRYNLYGQESLFTFYAGAHFASNQLTGDIDGEGYTETVTQYGNPTKYQNSMLRFMIAQPRAIRHRINQNLSNFTALVNTNSLFNIWNCLAFLIFSPLLAAANRPPIPGRVLIPYMTLLLLASPYFLIFHVDARYPLLFTVILMIWISVVSLVAWTAIGARFPLHWALRWLPAAGLALLCASNLKSAVEHAENAEINIEPWHQLADAFRAKVGNAGTPVVGFIGPNGVTVFGSDFYWFSYYARTALPWCGDPNCEAADTFPRTKIYSFLGKPQEYLWVTDQLASTVGGSPRVVQQHISAGTLGCYSLLKFDKNAPSGANVEPNRSESEDSCGGFSARFVERSDIDKVACAALGMQADGKADGLVEVQVPDFFRPPRKTNWLFQSSHLLYMNLQRSHPEGIYETNGNNFILGVSETPDGPLLNRNDGSVDIDSYSKFYLHYCRDEKDDPESTYRVTVDSTTFAVKK